MKIVYCISGTYNSGGMERVLANKVNYFAGQGNEVHIVTTDQRGQKPFFPMNGRIIMHDLAINYEENNGKSVLNKIVHYPFKQIRHWKRLDKLLKSLKADIVISMFCNDVNLTHRIKDGSRKILEVHFSRYKRLQYGRKGLWKMIDKIRFDGDFSVASSYDRFVVLTEEDKSYWGNMENIQVIPNARTFHVDQPANLKEKKVMAIGRYNYQKGFDRLIEAWAIVNAGHKDWMLEIVGDGELKSEYEEKIARLDLQDNIRLRKATTDIEDMYRHASIFALSSRYEGLPMVLLEAQAYGLPIVSFNCKCGPRDIIENGKSGFIVKDGDIAEFAEKLIKLMDDENLRHEMGQEAYRNSEFYSNECIMEKWETLFENVMN